MGAPVQLRGVLDRFEGHTAVLLFDDAEVFGPLVGQEFVLPKRLLPAEAKEGDVLVLDLLTEAQATAHREAVARQVLEQILNGQ